MIDRAMKAAMKGSISAEVAPPYLALPNYGGFEVRLWKVIDLKHVLSSHQRHPSTPPLSCFHTSHLS